MKVKDVTNAVDKLAYPEYAENYDNVGLLIGDYDNNISKILITLDITEAVLKEAIDNKYNLIISYHPIIFNGIKKIIGSNYRERIIISAIKHDISIYVIHTNLDVMPNGTNYYIGKRLGLIKQKILIPKLGCIKKLTTYVPKKYANIVRTSLFKVGAGNIGNYDYCSFNLEGIGSFRGKKDSNPFIGNKGEINFKEETCINVIFPRHKERLVIEAMIKNHPYEDVAYEVFDINNQYFGLGTVGFLKESMSEKYFFSFLKEKMCTNNIRHSSFLNKPIKKVALIGGSGSFGLFYAKEVNADIFISSDFKYHHFFETNILIADIGHYESEQFTKDLIETYLRDKFPNLVIFKSKINTNPVNYY
ncbi:MAG: Nif3-like dinuclear metal center hexameric protein [Candidatus Bostrichicola ureolyticus]|nr:MAG: Nif3-like dinuclear metal center hexameric protein [Candidatus Bostrichicola ureolyticus]